MPSRLEQLAALDFANAMPEVTETVIRRIGGNAERTEDVTAVTEFSQEGGGLTVNDNGKWIEVDGLMEIAADQAASEHDEWVIQDGPNAGVYRQRGAATGADGGSKTIGIVKRSGIVAKRPRIRQ